MLTNVNNLGCMIFLFIPSDLLGTSWMNWTMFGSCLLIGAVLFTFKEEYTRYNLDVAKPIQSGDKYFYTAAEDIDDYIARRGSAAPLIPATPPSTMTKSKLEQYEDTDVTGTPH